MLIFIRDGDATFTLNVNAGDVIEVSEIPTSAVGRPTEQQLNKMTVGEWQSVIRGLPLSGVPRGAKKAPLVQAILRACGIPQSPLNPKP